MVTYLSIFVVLSLVSFFSEIIQNNGLLTSRRISSFVISCILILFATLRKGTGSDYYSYESIWQGIKAMDFKNIFDTSYETLEPGFRLLVALLKVFTDFDRVFYLIMSMFAILPTWYGLRKICSNHIITGLFIFFLIFYIPYVFNGMRQAIAMGLFIYSIDFIRNRKLLNVSLIAFLALSFHFSGIIILISYFAYNIKLKPIVFFVLGTLISFIVSKLISVAYIFQLFNLNLYYLEDLNFSTSIFQLITRLAIALVMLLANYLFVIKKKLINEEVVFLSRLINIYLIGLFIYIYFRDLNVFATRINMFFRILEILIFPLFLSNIKVKSNRVLFFAIILLLGGYIFLMSLSVPENEFNYYFIN